MKWVQIEMLESGFIIRDKYKSGTTRICTDETELLQAVQDFVREHVEALECRRRVSDRFHAELDRN